MKFLRACLLVVPFCAPATAAPLLANGSFETGDFTGWAQSGNTEYTSVYGQDYDGLGPQDGVYYALLGPSGSDGVLSQSFIDAPGAALRISFWLASDGGLPSDFSASYNGMALMALADAGVFGLTEYSATVSGTGDDTLRFSFRDDQDYFALDDVEASEIPEPAPFFMVLPLGLWLFKRRQGALPL